MRNEVRQGLGLLLIAAVLWMLSTQGDNVVTDLLSGAAFLLGMGGLIVAAVGLLKSAGDRIS